MQPDTLRSVKEHDRRYAGLDILRAIAALAVLALHVSQLPLAGTSALDRVVHQLGGGVAIFFVLSGYLLYRPFIVAMLEERPAPDRRRFLRNRARRIIPAYWTALTVFAIAGLLYGSPGIPMLAACYGFLQSWVVHHQSDGIAPAWTLGSEAVFYIALPVLSALVARRRGTDAMAILRDLAVAIGLLWVVRFLIVDIGAAHVRPVIGTLNATILGTLDMFVVGMAMAVIVADPALSERARRLVPARRIAWPAALGLYLLVTLPHPIYDIVTKWSFTSRAWVMTISALLIAPLVLRPADAPQGRTARAFAFLGLVSYGIYIWHYPVVVRLADTGLPNGVRIAVSVAAALAMGVASYYVIERRFISGRRSQQPSLEVVPVPAA